MRAANYSPFHMADKYVLPSGGDLISVEISLFLHSTELSQNGADIDSNVLCLQLQEIVFSLCICV